MSERWKTITEIDTDFLCRNLLMDLWPKCLTQILRRCGRAITTFNYGKKYEERFRKKMAHLTDQLLITLFQKAPNLRVFYINRAHVERDAFVWMREMPNKIEKFCLVTCKIEFDSANQFAEIICGMVTRCQSLKHFGIVDHETNVGYYIFDKILMSLPPTITFLALPDGLRLNSNYTHFENLMALELRKSIIDSRLLNELFRVSNKLRFLDLSYMPELRDFKGIAELTELRFLSLNDNLLNDEQLTYVLKNAAGLEALSLEYCSNLTSSALMQLARCTNIKYLYLTKVRVTDEVLSNIVVHCPLLEALDISWCTALTTSSLSKLPGLTHLNHLLVANVYEFDEEHAYALRAVNAEVEIKAKATKSTMTYEECMFHSFFSTVKAAPSPEKHHIRSMRLHKFMYEV